MGGERASPLSTEQVVAIDGKASRRSRKRGLQALHLVSDFATEARLILGQEACAEKSNELTAIPVLLDSLMLKGVIVTIDAMGTHTNIARAIRDKEADYVLAVKDNQTKLAGSIIDFFEVSETTGWKNTPHSFVASSSTSSDSTRRQSRAASTIVVSWPPLQFDTALNSWALREFDAIALGRRPFKAKTADPVQ